MKKVLEVKKEFLKKSFSVGHHNIRYKWHEIAIEVINLAYIGSSIEDTELSDPETIRKRIRLDSSEWKDFFSEAMLEIIRLLVRMFPRLRWSVLIDETPDPFYGDMDAYQGGIRKTQEHNPLIRQHITPYRSKKGATGSFQFLVMALRSTKGLFTFFIEPIHIGMQYEDYIEDTLADIHRILPSAPLMADRGFPSVAFFQMLKRLGMDYVVRLPRKGKLKTVTKKEFRHTYVSGPEKISFHVTRGMDGNTEYFFATSYWFKPFCWHRQLYKGRWGIENAFKYADKAMLSTSSKNIRMRLFCQVLSLFLVNFWYLERIIQGTIRSFKKFLKCFCKSLAQQIRDAIQQANQLNNTAGKNPAMAGRN